MRSGPERAELIERDTLFDFVQPAVPAIYRLSERRRGCQAGGELHLYLSLNEAHEEYPTSYGRQGWPAPRFRWLSRSLLRLVLSEATRVERCRSICPADGRVVELEAATRTSPLGLFR